MPNQSDEFEELPDVLPKLDDAEKDAAEINQNEAERLPDTALGKLERDVRRVIQRFLKRRDA